MKKIIIRESQLREILDKQKEKSIIDVEKLKQYANGISICCDGEYGVTFLNEGENHIYIMLGDSNPFDGEYLEMFIKEAVSDGWKNSEKIKVTIENESFPSGEGWLEYDTKKNDFIQAKRH